MKSSLFKIIERPIVTEKGTYLKDEMNQYLFEVDNRANKLEIKNAVQKIFNVKVKSVKTLINRGKIKRIGKREGKRPNWKKAIVTIQEGSKINYFEGV